MTTGEVNTRWKAYKIEHGMFERHTKATTAGGRPMKCFYIAHALAAKGQRPTRPTPIPDEL